MDSSRHVGVGIVLVVAAVVAAGSSAPVVTAGTDGGSTTIDSCTTITEPGRYVLADDITGSDEDTCIRIEASDVVFDGGGHTIEGVRNESDIETATDDTLPPRTNVGVSVNASETISNVTVENVTIRGWYYGIAAEDVSTVVVRDSTVTENGVGVHVRDSSDVSLEDVTPTNNVVTGILIEHTGVTVTNTSTDG